MFLSFEKTHKKPSLFSNLLSLPSQTTLKLTRHDMIQLFKKISNQTTNIDILHSVGGFKQLIRTSSQNLTVRDEAGVNSLMFMEQCELDFTDATKFFFMWLSDDTASITYSNPIPQRSYSNVTITFSIQRSFFYEH